MGSDSEAEKSAHKEKKKALALAPIAKPLAGKKLSKRALKLVRRAAEQKCLKRGVKEVVKSIRRGNKGLCIIAGNISPIDVITHVRFYVKRLKYPTFTLTPKKNEFVNCIECTCAFDENRIAPINKSPTEIVNDLANAGATKRPTCCVLVLTKPTKGELSQEEQEKLKSDYDQVVSDVSELASSMF